MRLKLMRNCINQKTFCYPLRVRGMGQKKIKNRRHALYRLEAIKN
jgi:hypothetical protein